MNSGDMNRVSEFGLKFEFPGSKNLYPLEFLEAQEVAVSGNDEFGPAGESGLDFLCGEPDFDFQSFFEFFAYGRRNEQVKFPSVRPPQEPGAKAFRQEGGRQDIRIKEGSQEISLKTSSSATRRRL